MNGRIPLAATYFRDTMRTLKDGLSLSSSMLFILDANYGRMPSKGMIIRYSSQRGHL